MKKTTKRNIIISVIAIGVSMIAIGIDYCQHKSLKKLQYEFNSINYRPTIKIENILLTAFLERIDSINFSKYLIDTMTDIKVNSKIQTDINFDLINIGNSTAKIVAAYCIDTVSGDAKLRELIYKKVIELQFDSSNNEFYTYWHLLPSDKDKLKFHKTIDFINKNIFTIHLLLFYENDLGMLYDTYYWARFKKNDLTFGVLVDPRNEKLIAARLEDDFKEYVKKIDDNNAYKVYSKKEKKHFDKLYAKMKNNLTPANTASKTSREKVLK